MTQATQEEPRVTVNIKREPPKIRPTLKLTPPEGGWNPAIHQKARKPIGKTK